MPIHRTDLDFFKCQVLQNKECVFVYRSTECYFYSGNEKYILNDPEVTSKLYEDKTLKGFLHFQQAEEYYCLSFIENKHKPTPIVIRIGNIIDDLA